MAEWLFQLLLAICTLAQSQGLLLFSAVRNSEQHPNHLTFTCEDESGHVANPIFFRNGVQFLPTSTAENGFLFHIDRTKEGNFSCGRNGDEDSSSNIRTLVAWPDSNILPRNTGPFHAAAGSTVRLDCLITPGVVVEQYYVTWRSASDQSRVFYQSFPPHLNESPVNIDPRRYSVNSKNFSLFIHNVKPSDGVEDYYCILGVEDTHPDLIHRPLIYTRTENTRLSLLVTAPPEITQGPSDKEITRGDTVSFTCVARNSPEPASIDWMLNDTLVSSALDKYLRYNITTRPPRLDTGYTITESTLTISNANGGDSSVVRCHINASGSEQSARLSVLDKVRRFVPKALQSGGFLYELELDAPLLVPVKLLFSYFEVGSTKPHNYTSKESYSSSVVIKHVADEDEVPFDKFHVKVALLYEERGREDLVGPFTDDMEQTRAGLTDLTISLICLICIVVVITIIILLSVLGLCRCLLSSNTRTMTQIEAMNNFFNTFKTNTTAPAAERNNNIQSDSASMPLVSEPSVSKKNNGFSDKTGQRYVAALVKTIKFAQGDTVLSVFLEKELVIREHQEGSPLNNGSSATNGVALELKVDDLGD